MSRRRRLTFYLLSALIVLTLVVPTSALHAQESSTPISVILPDFVRMLLGEDAFEAFEAEHPGVDIYPVYASFEDFYFTSPVDDLEQHLDDVQDYVSRADLVLVMSNSLSVEATRAGYFLDLAPLANTDVTLDTADFIPAVWQSFQWDGGIWAVPISTDVITLVYDPAAFDAAGLAYPNENWTIDDLANAARALTQRDANGEVTMTGLLDASGDGGWILRSLMGQGVYDANVLPNPPNFANPALESLLTTWQELQDEGVVNGSFGNDFEGVPMRIIAATSGMMIPNPERQVAGTLLPGNVAGLDVLGFAISSGTLYPELAFEVAEYLTRSPEFANSIFSSAPARRSMIGVEPDPEEGMALSGLEFSPEAQALIDRGLENGLPSSEVRYFNYVLPTMGQIGAGGDARTVLQEAEAQAVANLQTAADRRGTTVVQVATPPPAIELQPGEVALDFGILSYVYPFPNEGQWNQIIQDFVANDPQVGQINFNNQPPMGANSVASYAEQNDCFIFPYNAVPGLDLTTVLNLDPFLDADPNFDETDVIGNTMAQLQRDNLTWAYPIVIQPQALMYNVDLFNQAGVPLPENGWTMSAFVDALRMLRPTPDDATPFVPNDPGGTYLLMLIAAYGGIPLDFRTDPATINYTDPATVDAIRQVLDLARDGYIGYQALAQTNFSVSFGGGEDIAITTQSLMAGLGFVESSMEEGPDPYRMTTYPTGTQYNAVSYDSVTAYISATAENPDACYRWISEVARHPELFSGLPVRRSAAHDPAYLATAGEETAAFFDQFDTMMQNPNTVVFPSIFAGGDNAIRNYLLQYWLNRAFDRYVLEEADLQTELELAQGYATAFQECALAIPPFDPNSQDEQSYSMQYIDCATAADPEIASMFQAATGSSVE